MNRPDETTIQSWMRGELEGEELRKMEAWAEENADLLEKEMGWETLGQTMNESLPQSEELPYPDFFNERVKHHALDLPEEKEVMKSPSLLQRLNWLLAPAAIAGMALCFYLGTMMQAPETVTPVVTLETVYTPIDGVSSEVLQAGESTVIVLDGLDEIPESLDIAAGETSSGISPLLLAQADRTTFLF